MRLNGEISSGREEEEEDMDGEMNALNYSIGGVGFPQSQRLIVGYALTSKKKKSFLQPKLVGLARYVIKPICPFFIFLYYCVCIFCWCFQLFVGLLYSILIWVAKFFVFLSAISFGYVVL